MTIIVIIKATEKKRCFIVFTLCQLLGKFSFRINYFTLKWKLYFRIYVFFKCKHNDYFYQLMAVLLTSGYNVFLYIKTMN